MSIRARILVLSAFLVLLPLLILAGLIRTHINGLLAHQFEERVDRVAEAVRQDLDLRDGTLRERLAALGRSMADDNRVRRALLEDAGPEHRYLLDYAERVMPLLGLAMLQIRDEQGAVLSSGHFHGEHGQVDPELAPLVQGAGGAPLLMKVMAAQGAFLALARMDSVRLGGHVLWLIGGARVDEAFLRSLAGGADAAVSLVYPGDPAAGPGGAGQAVAGGITVGSGALSSDPRVRDRLTGAIEVRNGGIGVRLPTADFLMRSWKGPFLLGSAAGDRLQSCLWVVSHPRAALAQVHRNIDRWLLVVLLSSLVGTLLLAVWLSMRIMRPLQDLAEKTAAIDLGRLHIGFETRRQDEVGALARLLAAMTERLRRSAEQLRAAERHATLGEMARQVNHDIRNGLAPIRNAIRHLAQVAEEAPDRIGAVFGERRAMLESSVAYLETLADNYARISTHPVRRPCDLGAIVQEVVRAMSGRARPLVQAVVAPGLDAVSADPVALRRIVENLVRNACESIGDRQGRVRILVDNASDDGDAGVRLVVSDTGPGIAPEVLQKIFTDFYTTKRGGAGLGLSIVRRLVTDFGGRVRADSVPGEGATFTVWLPRAEDEHGQADSDRR